jgi:2-haloacid dehalogenase
LDLFEDVIISGHVGMAKPDTAIFEKARDRFKVDPAATLFIDDSLKNVNAAKGVGFQAVLFETPEKLRQDLIGLGVFAS